MLQKILIPNTVNADLLTFCSSKNQGFPQTYLSSTTVFNIDNNKKCFLKLQFLSRPGLSNLGLPVM